VLRFGCFHQPTSYRLASSTAIHCALPAIAADVTVLTMHTLARLIQAAGLTIPPLAIIAQLMEQITLSQMLGFLAVSVGLFLIGYLLQRYSGGGQQ
jgi:hypothetical protein